MSWQAIRKGSSSAGNRKIKELLERLAKFQSDSLQIEDEDLILLGFTDHGRLCYHDTLSFTNVKITDAIAYQMPVEPDGNQLSLWHRFDGRTVLEDAARFEHTGVVYGEPTPVYGQDEGMGMRGAIALDFDGTDDYVRTPSSTRINLTGASVGFSAFMRFSLNNIAGDQVLFMKTDDATPLYGYEAWVESTGDPTANYDHRNYDSLNYGTYKAGKLQFIVKFNGTNYKCQSVSTIDIATVYDAWFVFNASALTVSIILNGAADSEVSTATPKMTAGTDFGLFYATKTSHTANFFDGLINDFRFWDARVINTTEAGQQYINKLSISNIVLDRVGVVSYSVIPQAHLATINEPQYFVWFDGIDDNISVPNTTSIDSFTSMGISFWINPQTMTTGTFRTIIDKGWNATGGFTMFQDTTVKNRIYTSINIAGTQYNSFNDGITDIYTWYHVAGVWTGTSLITYINGVAGTPVTTPTGTLTNATALKVGQATTDYAGYMSDLRIHKNRTITAADVALLYAGNDITNTGLSLWYTFYEGIGTVIHDLSYNGNTGTATGVLWSKRFSRLTFDGLTGYIDLLTPAAFLVGETAGSAASYSAWFKRANVPFTQTEEDIATKNRNGLTLLVNTAGNAEVDFRYNTAATNFVNSGVNVCDDKWHHLVGTHSDTTDTQKVYVDGILTNTTTTNDFFTPSGAGKFTIGGRKSASPAQYFFNGQIKDVRMYNVQISQTDVTDLFLGKDVTTGQVGRWKLDEMRNNGLKVFDSQATNSGTMIGIIQYTIIKPNSYIYNNFFTPIRDSVTILKHLTNPTVRTVTETTTISDSVARIKNPIVLGVPATQVVAISETVAIQKLSFQTKQGRFTKSTITSGYPFTQDIEVGFRPKFIIFWGVNNQSLSAFQNEWECNIGFTDGTNERSMAASSDDDVGTTEAWKRSSDSAITDVRPDGTLSYEMNTSFTDNGFRLTYLLNNTNADIILYCAFGGSSITDCKVGDFAMPTTVTGNQAITGVGFQPTGILYLPTAAIAQNTAAANASVMIGAAASTSSRMAIAFGSQDNVGTSATFRHMTDAHDITRVTIGSGSITKIADFISFNADGFTNNFTATTGVADLCNYLAFSGLRFKVGSFSVTTGTGLQSITGTGFRPKLVMFFSHMKAKDSSTTTLATNNRYSIGAATDSITRRCAVSADLDAQDKTITSSRTDASDILRSITPKKPAEGSVTRIRIDFSSMNADGFTLNKIEHDGSACDIIYWAFGV